MRSAATAGSPPGSPPAASSTTPLPFSPSARRGPVLVKDTAQEGNSVSGALERTVMHRTLPPPAGGYSCAERLSEVVPVYAASDHDVCSVDMSLHSVHAEAA